MATVYADENIPMGNAHLNSHSKDKGDDCNVCKRFRQYNQSISTL